MRTRFLRRSATRGGQSRNHPLQLRNQTQNARGYTENPARFFRPPQITRHSTQLPPAPGTPARVRRARETKRGSSRGSRARQHSASLRAKFCLHHPNRHLGDAPREGCACERADSPRCACFPLEQGSKQLRRERAAPASAQTHPAAPASPWSRGQSNSLWFSSPRISADFPIEGGGD